MIFRSLFYGVGERLWGHLAQFCCCSLLFFFFNDSMLHLHDPTHPKTLSSWLRSCSRELALMVGSIVVSSFYFINGMRVVTECLLSLGLRFYNFLTKLKTNK